jgi:phage repressor protein C with HTH and peptisase S24 domain
MAMTEQHERLKAAREARGYRTARAAAEAMGVAYSTYSAHENGEKGLSRSGQRYARFFGVSLDWLLTGRGEMRPTHEANQVPICGIVTAGLSSIPADQDESVAALGYLSLPNPTEVDAHRVEGESQWPRFQHGEYVLIGRRSTSPEKLIGELAMVQLEDGRRMLKTIQRGRIPGLYTLESHNAPPEHDARVLAAWPFRGLLTG